MFKPTVSEQTIIMLSLLTRIDRLEDLVKKFGNDPELIAGWENELKDTKDLYAKFLE